MRNVRRPSRYFFLAFVLVLVPPVLPGGEAPEEGFSLPEVLVTAPSFRLFPNSPLTSTVLDRKKLRSFGARTLGDALTQSAGVDTASLGSSGSSQWISLRGASAEQVLVLLDGRRLNAAQGGGADLSLVPLGSLERVEIIRGCAPSRYGVEGLGGIVNLVTERASLPDARGRLEAASGSEGARRLTASLDSPLRREGDLHLRLAGSLGSSASTFTFHDPLRSEDRLRENADTYLQAAEAGLEYDVPLAGGPLRFLLETGQTVSRRGSPGLVEFPTPRARLDETRGSLFLRASRSVPAGGLRDIEVSFLSSRRTLRYRDPDERPEPAGDSHAYDLEECTLDLGHDWGDHFLVRSGSGISFHRLDSTTDGFRYDRSAFLSVEPRFLLDRFAEVAPEQDFSARLSVEGGLRAESSLLHPPVTAPRAGLLVTLHRPSRTAIRANLGRLVRNPSFNDLFFSSSAFARGNPSLRPEKGRVWDAGVLASPGPLALSLTYFHHDIRDLIQWSPDFSGRWRPLNLSRAVLTGLEGEGAFSFSLSPAFRGALEGSLTRLHAVDRSGSRNLDGKLLPRRPPFKSGAGLRLGWRDRIRWFWRTRFVSYRWLDAPNVRYLPGCFLHGTGVGVSFASSLEISFSVQNLTDRAFVDLNEYPLPGRQWEVRTAVAF